MKEAPRAGGRRRPDYALIEALVPPGAKVLDLGCGDGELLDNLIQAKGCEGQGIEIKEQLVAETIRRGVPVYHGDMLEGMTHYRDDSFDVVILSQTLQQTTDPLAVIEEMLRVGRRAIISFPNFGHWRIRLQLLLEGRMPRSELLSYPWFNTPNVHLCTITDFRGLCAAQSLRIVEEIFLTPSFHQIGSFLANWRAGLAIFQVERKEVGE
ncbi:MAG: methionine biosynthesis protein MetW [Anaerolineae bacterium]